MFVALLMGDGIGPLVERTTAAWDDAVAAWSQRRSIVLFEEAATVLAGSVTRWAAIPVTDDEVPGLARDLLALVDGFATGRPRYLPAPPPPSAPAVPAAAATPGWPSWCATSARGARRCRRARRSASSRG